MLVFTRHRVRLSAFYRCFDVFTVSFEWVNNHKGDLETRVGGRLHKTRRCAVSNFNFFLCIQCAISVWLTKRVAQFIPTFGAENGV